MKKNYIIGLVVAVVIVAGGAVAIAATHKSSPEDPMQEMQMTHMPATTGTDPTDTGDAVATDTVSIKEYAFTPEVIKVKVGTKVTWTNQDSVGHTVTADKASAAAPDSQNLTKGQSYSFTFTKAGTYHYHCAPHPYMKGTVEVTE
jgi:amicyanin